MFRKEQIKSLNAQWGMDDSLEQYAIVHLEDKETGWDWYLLNMSPDQSITYAIESCMQLQITRLDLEFIEGHATFDQITIDNEFLPIKASILWQKLQKKNGRIWNLA